MSVTIISFDHTDKGRLRDFVRVPLYLYKDDAFFVPQLEYERMEHLSTKNPYFQHAVHRLFLAYDRDGAPVGRISAQIDDLAPAGTGQFGFVDAVDEVTLEALLKAAENWLKEGGAITVQGPYSLSINDEAGLLVEGFESCPRMMMNYAPRWIGPALEALGYRKAKDLFAFTMRTNRDIPPQIIRMAQRAGDEIHGLRTRALSRKSMEADLKVILDIFNRAWLGNWGFVPMNEAEMSYTAHSMAPLIDPSLVRIAEIDGIAAAMIVALPDLNEAIVDLGGSLLPLGWWTLIRRLKITGLCGARVLLMGVDPRYQEGLVGGALALMLIVELHTALREGGYDAAELSWILEDNTRTIRMIQTVGAEKYKTYRIYEKELV